MLAIFAIVVVAGTLWTIAQPRRYVSTADIIVTQTTSASEGTHSGIQILDDLQGLTKARSIATQVAVLQSPTLKETALKKLSPAQRKALGIYDISISNQKDTDIISVVVIAAHPDSAAVLANDIVDTYKARDLQENREATQTASMYIQDELRRVGDELHRARRQLADYKKKTRMYEVGTTGDHSVAEPTLQQRANYVATLEADQQAAIRNLQETRETIQSVAAALSTTDKEIVAETSEASSPLRTQIETEIETLETTRTQLLQSYLATAPEVKALDEQIHAARQRLTLHLASEIAGVKRTENPLHQALQQQYVSARVQADAAQTRITALQRQLDVLHKSLAALPDQELQATELVGSVTQLQNTYALLSEKYQELRISEEARLTNVRLVNAARPDAKPVSPNIPRNMILFIFVGAMLRHRGGPTAGSTGRSHPFHRALSNISVAGPSWRWCRTSRIRRSSSILPAIAAPYWKAFACCAAICSLPTWIMPRALLASPARGRERGKAPMPLIWLSPSPWTASG